MEPLFHAGDRVVIDDEMREGEKLFFEREGARPFLYRTVTTSRLRYRGTVAEILRVSRTGDGHIYYSLDVDSQSLVWPASMLLPVQEIECEADIGVLF